jgi:AcrR family transcriptional regulator
MGIKERRHRERQELKQAILDAAREIAAHESWQAVTIRKVADRIEYSPPTIYEHFANKDAILIELMREGFRLLLAGIRAGDVPSAGAEARLLALANAYWAFAWAYPELYQVMHGLGGVPFCVDGVAGEGGSPPAEAEAVFVATSDILRALPSMAEIATEDLDAAVLILWATLHGLVALTMAGRIKGGRECALQLVDQAIHDFLAAHGTAKVYSVSPRD